MQIELLGPLRVRAADGTEVPVPGVRLRRLLAELALRAGRPVSTALLEDLLWPDDTPGGPGALQSLVSRLRRTLGNSATVTAGPAGYVLTGVEVDVPRVEAAFARGHGLLRDGDWAAAAAVLTAALASWRGPLAEIGRTPDAVRLEESRLDALADRCEARWRSGELDGLPADLEELVLAHPLRERFAELLVRVLGAAGRGGEALAAYERTRKVLADELGADPSPGLREAHLAVLADPPAPSRPALPPARALTSFVGRDDDLARLGRLLGSARCVTVVGPGGAGKTRLSTETVSALGPGWKVHVVALAPVAEGADVLGAVAAAVGARDTAVDRRSLPSEVDVRSRVLRALSGPRTLLVLDNCEHVIDDVAYLVEDLLGSCAGLTVLATSREALGVDGEVLHPLGPLRGAEAVRLFAERAAAVAPGFTVTEQNSAVVQDVVRRLDGLPLALELAAARLRTMTPADLLDRLSDRFRVLTGGRRTAIARHRTLRAVVDWSWDLLESDERSLLQRLSIFHAPVSVEAAVAVGADLGDELTVADLLGSLTEKSLLQLRPADPTPNPARYGLLETIREYGAERLAVAGELGGVLEARTRWALRVAGQAATGLRGSGQVRWSRRIDAEYEDLLAAVRHLAATGRGLLALELATPLAVWWTALGRHPQVVEWLGAARSCRQGARVTADRVAETLEIVNSTMDGATSLPAALPRLQELQAEVAAAPERDRTVLPVLLTTLVGRFFAAMSGQQQQMPQDLPAEYLDQVGEDPWLVALTALMRAALAENTGDVARMVDQARRAEAGFSALGESLARAGAMRLLAQAMVFDGDLDAAEELFREAGDVIAVFGNAEDEVQLRMQLVDVLQRRGRDAEAAAELERMKASASSVAGSTRTWLVLSEVGLLRRAGRTAEAGRLVRDQLAEMDARPGGDVWTHERAVLQTHLAHVQLEEGDARTAADLLGAAFESAARSHDMPILSTVVVGLARRQAYAADPRSAARLLGIAAALRGADDPTDPETSRLREQAEQAVGVQEFADAYAQGRRSTRAAALAELRSAFTGGSGGA